MSNLIINKTTKIQLATETTNLEAVSVDAIKQFITEAEKGLVAEKCGVLRTLIIENICSAKAQLAKKIGSTMVV